MKTTDERGEHLHIWILTSGEKHEHYEVANFECECGAWRKRKVVLWDLGHDDCTWTDGRYPKEHRVILTRARSIEQLEAALSANETMLDKYTGEDARRIGLVIEKLKATIRSKRNSE